MDYIKISYKMNFPDNIPKQMKENTKDFQRYLKILESSNQRKCPQSIFIILFIIIMFILIIILILN